MNKKVKSNHFFEHNGEKYGLLCDINVIRKIQEEYESFLRWMSMAFGSDMWQGYSSSGNRSNAIKDHCSLLLDIIDENGKIHRGCLNEASNLVLSLAYIYYAPVKCIQKGESYFVEGYEQLEDMRRTGEVLNEEKISLRASALLDGAKIMVDEYVAVCNQNCIHNQKAPLDIRYIGRLPLNKILSLVSSAINSSFPYSKKNQGFVKFDSIDLSWIYVFAMSKLGFSYLEVGRLTLKRFEELCSSYKKMM